MKCIHSAWWQTNQRAEFRIFDLCSELIDIVHCTPRTVLWTAWGAYAQMCAWPSHCLIHFFCWVNPFLLYLFVTFKRRFLLQNILSYLCFCCVWIWLINLHLRLLLKLDKPMHLHWILMLVQCTLPLGHWTHQNPAHVHWTCPISLAKVNVHLLTS